MQVQKAPQCSTATTINHCYEPPQKHYIDSSPREPRFVLVPRAGLGKPWNASNSNKPVSSWPLKQGPKKWSKHGCNKGTLTVWTGSFFGRRPLPFRHLKAFCLLSFGGLHLRIARRPARNRTTRQSVRVAKNDASELWTGLCSEQRGVPRKHTRAGFEADLESLQAMQIGKKQNDKEGDLFWTSKRRKSRRQKWTSPVQDSSRSCCWSNQLSLE